MRQLCNSTGKLRFVSHPFSGDFDGETGGLCERKEGSLWQRDSLPHTIFILVLNAEARRRRGKRVGSVVEVFCFLSLFLSLFIFSAVSAPLRSIQKNVYGSEAKRYRKFFLPKSAWEHPKKVVT
jgi:hypothetical protein